MTKDFKAFCDELTSEIQDSYTGEVSIAKAERLAAKFLHAQIQVSDQLRNRDLDARMRKSGVKGVKAAAYMAIATASDKKPSDTFIENSINTNELVNSEQDKLDQAEVDRDSLERYYDIFREAHIYYRNLAKATFGG